MRPFDFVLCRRKKIQKFAGTSYAVLSNAHFCKQLQNEKICRFKWEKVFIMATSNRAISTKSGKIPFGNFLFSQEEEYASDKEFSALPLSSLAASHLLFGKVLIGFVIKKIIHL